VSPQLAISGRKLVDSLSFSHFAELIEIEDPLKRAFYEIECIRGNWSVRALKRQEEIPPSGCSRNTHSWNRPTSRPVWFTRTGHWLANRCRTESQEPRHHEIPDGCMRFVAYPAVLSDRTSYDVMSAMAIDPKASDDRLLLFALEDERVLLTEDRDFGELAFVRKKLTPFDGKPLIVLW
jgi:hypothetical protein